jgi:hypothetical protein
VSNNTLGFLEGVEVILDIMVNTEISDWVINWIWVLLLWVLVLVASSGRADWVGLGLKLDSGVINGELVVQSSLGILEVGDGSDDIAVKIWLVIIQGLLSWVNWWLLEMEVPVVSNDSLSLLERVEVGLDIVIGTEVWDWVVNWVWGLLLWVLVLSATS